MSGPLGSSQWMYSSGDFFPYKINQSLRFDDDSNTYLNRTPGSSGNRKTWTYSFWFKHGSRTAIFDFLLANGGSDPFFEFSLTSAQKFQIFYHNETMLVSTRQLRDRSAWYHILLRHDTSQGTADNRLRIYVNGSELTNWDTNGRANLPQDFDGGVNQSGVAHYIGRNHVGNNDLDGYMAEVHLVDGTSYGPENFGETKAGIWIPKEYTGSHGTQGWYLPFDDGSALGDDESANTNDWTANAFGGTVDVMLDTPTNNFATMMFDPPAADINGYTLSEGNLKLTAASTGQYSGLRTTMNIPSTGKWYMEVLRTNIDAGPIGEGDHIFGLTTRSKDLSNNSFNLDDVFGVTGQAGNLHRDLSGEATVNTLVNAAATDDIVQFAIDADSGKVFIGENNTYSAEDKGTDGNPSTGANETGTLQAADFDELSLFLMLGTNSGYTMTATANFGQDSSFAGEKTAQGNKDSEGIGDFYYAVPTGYKALCTANLPTPGIDPAQGPTPEDYFNTVLYTGNSSAGRNITGFGFQPDWVWVKERGAINNHILSDSVRGADKGLHSDSSTQAEFDDVLSAFVSDGFTASDHGTVNNNSDTYVAWAWKAGTSFSNDASATSIGSIDSTGSVNTEAGFSIISYTGTGAAATVAHGLNAVPTVYICKARTDTGGDENFLVYHSQNTTAPQTDYLLLNSTQATEDSDGAFNDTAPTSTVFSIGSFVDISKSGVGYIAYVFTDIEGFSKHGKYVGNGNADGTFVFTGFRPAWLMVKNTSGTGGWEIHDNRRLGFNTSDETLDANTNAAEATGNDLDFVANGFKVRNTYGTSNTSGSTYVYLAFAEQPFKYANAR